MQLVSTNLSPYSARVRALIHFKSLDIDIIEPDPPLKSDGFKAQFALGQIPILILDDGCYLSESWAILNYLEDIYPTPSLIPKIALERANMHMYKGFTDFLLKDSLFPLFLMLGDNKKDPVPAIANIKSEIGKFDRLLGDMKEPSNRPINLGDIALVPSMYFTVALSQIFGEHDLFSESQRVGAWWNWVQQNPSLEKIIDEMDQALKTRTG